MPSFPVPIHGVTLDSIDHIDKVILSLIKLPVKPTTRIVFDDTMPAIYYLDAVEDIHKISYIMGELLDSCNVSKYSVEEYVNRTKDYLNVLGDYVDIWEIGNEVNGEWLGNPEDVKNKVIAAYQLVKSQNKQVALTLHYSEGCCSNPENEMFTWANNQIPEDMKEGLDYVFISYYADDCPGPTPDWQNVFSQLHNDFPNAKIGFGESGTKHKSKKAHCIKEFYSLDIKVPNYVGGYFWWYFQQDMVPHTKPLWTVLESAMNEQKGLY